MLTRGSGATLLHAEKSSSPIVTTVESFLGFRARRAASSASSDSPARFYPRNVDSRSATLMAAAVRAAELGLLRRAQEPATAA